MTVCLLQLGVYVCVVAQERREKEGSEVANRKEELTERWEIIEEQSMYLELC